MAVIVNTQFTLNSVTYAPPSIIYDTTTISAIAASQFANFVSTLGGATVPGNVSSVLAAGTDATTTPITLPSNYVQLGQLQVNRARANFLFANSSTATLYLQYDNGDGTQATILPMAPAATNGAQGIIWEDSTFKGRVTAYGPPGTIAPLRENNRVIYSYS